MEQQEHITRIKAKDRINFVRIRPDRPTEYVYVEFKESPRPEFDIALQALVPVVIELCSLEEVVWKDGEITLVSFVRSGLSQVGFAASITLKREGKSPLNQSLPYVPADEVSDKLQLQLKRLIDEAWHYVKGVRRLQQTSLFAPTPEAEEALV